MPFERLVRILTALSLLLACSAHAHESENHDRGTALYLGNEGVLVSTDYGDVLFDPFFHNDYGQYRLVPDDIRQRIFSGEEPYDDIRVVLISHAHADHFSAKDAFQYLQDNERVTLVGPGQAIDQVRSLEGASAIESRLRAIRQEFGDPVVELKLDNIGIESVRIAHAGWPSRKNVSNLVYRVTFGDELNVIHMGDADPNDIHFKPYKAHWEKAESELAFPPYWFFASQSGVAILSDRINTLESIGIHVPVRVPLDLRLSKRDYFSTPGETRTFSPRHVAD